MGDRLIVQHTWACPRSNAGVYSAPLCRESDTTDHARMNSARMETCLGSQSQVFQLLCYLPGLTFGETQVEDTSMGDLRGTATGEYTISQHTRWHSVRKMWATRFVTSSPSSAFNMQISTKCARVPTRKQASAVVSSNIWCCHWWDWQCPRRHLAKYPYNHL